MQFVETNTLESGGVEEQVFVALRFDKPKALVRQLFDDAFSHWSFLFIELIFGLKVLYCYGVLRQVGFAPGSF